MRALVSRPRSPTRTTRREPEAGAQLVDLRAQGGRIGRVAREDLDRHRAALGVAQQAEDDLRLAALAVAGVAVARQRAAAALHPGRADVVEHQGAVGEMTPGQAPLDRPLAFQQPVHRRIERVFVDRAQPQLPGQAVAQRVVAQTARGGQLGARGEDAGPRSWPPPGARRREGLAAIRRSSPRPRRLASTAATWPWGLERAMAKASSGATRVWFLSTRRRASILAGGPFGEVGDGALLDLSALAPAFAQEDGGG